MNDDTPPPEDTFARIAELERELASARERIVRAELKAEATRAGMVDLDGLKLIDTAKLTLGENGEVEGAGAVMRELRRAKPWLFGGASSSSTASAPPARAPQARPATEMSFDEWQKARAELLKRR
jgi:hypothetical protein